MGEQGALGIGEMGNDEVGNGDVGNGDVGNGDMGNDEVGNGYTATWTPTKARACERSSGEEAKKPLHAPA